MQLRRLLVNSLSALILSACAVIAATPAQADTIAWANWTSGTSGSPGSATGSIGSITVTYSGQTSGLLINYPSWGPTATFTGGVVGNPPPHANNSVGLEGGVTYTETITFSQVVADPIFAVWSLGQGGAAASFDFTSAEPFNVLGGGPSNEYGGTALTINGENVEGREGNGIIQFIGDYSSITFTTPQYENYYAFTVGEDADLTSELPGTVPEPATISLFGLGLAALPIVRRSLARRRS